ncbi:ABC transporter substrate-binding protein [Frondihabitans sp. PhB188]|uniref:ABC transporter substrate-binding protein n=1 Tax=Frondihabitans sp. PhB188 TaxID=2485200 RepID=UPI0013150D9E|nr:ABC transporter substrate-binding protein [Frondihabitans sp. PhB188]
MTATVLVLTGCSNLAPKQTTGKTVVEVLPALATQLSFDTSFALTAGYFDTGDYLFNDLITQKYVAGDQKDTQDQDIYNFTGVLAKSYTKSEDGLTYTFNLRHGVKSQRGNELTSEDVLWSFERKMKAATSIVPYVITPALTDLKQITAPDKYTVKFTVAKAAYGFTLLSNLSDIVGQIYDSTFLKKHVTKDDPYATKFSSGRFDFGFGAYKVASVTEGSEMVLEARTDTGLANTPTITKIIQRVVADAGNRATALKNGDADVALGLLPADQASLEKDSGVLVPKKARNGYVAIQLNVKTGPFKDIAVRKAFTTAIDYGQVIDGVLQGRATKKNTMLDSGAPGYDGSGLPDYSYDAATSKKVLKAAGYTTNIPVTLTVANDNQAMVDTAVAIKSSAEAAGFDITVDSVPTAQAQERGTKGQTEASLFTGEALALSQGYQLGLQTTPGSSSNYSQYDDPTFAKLLATANDVPDPLTDEGGKAYNAAEKRWLGDQIAAIYIAQPASDSAVSSKLHGWTWRLDHAVDLSVMTKD